MPHTTRSKDGDNLKKTVTVFLTLILLLFASSAIFGFSSQTAADSGDMSRQVTRFIVSIFTPGFEEMSLSEQNALIADAHGTVRKLAHFAEYAFFGCILMAHLTAVLSTFSYFANARLTVLIGVIYATFDEIHQSFVGGRSPQVFDVLVDSLGVIVGVLAVIGILIIIRRHGKRRLQ